MGRRVVSQVSADDIFGVSAQLAYFFLFSIFPLLLFLTTLLGYFADDVAVRGKIFLFLQEVIPSREAFELVRDTLDEVIRERGGGKLSFGLLVALWAASAGMVALIEGLNTAFDVTEKRPWLKTRLRALIFVVLLGIQLGAALALIFYGAEVGYVVGRWLHLGLYFGPAWAIVSWLLVLALLILTFDFLYNLGPSLERYRWRWLTPGAVAGVWLWLAVSLGFRLYLTFFNTYSRSYGSLGTVIILLLWLYLTGSAILVGAEVNSEIYKAERDLGGSHTT